MCDECGKCFADKRRLEVHKETHAEVKKFPCPICPESFRRETLLAKHMTIHTGGLITIINIVIHTGGCMLNFCAFNTRINYSTISEMMHFNFGLSK